MAKSRSLQQAVRFALATASAAAGVTSLHAQEAPAAAAPVEEVVVTGSRLSNPNETSISPITSVSATDIQATGLTRVEDVLNNLPMVFAGENSTVSNGSDGTATIDLRGLGPQRTVVLVNGRRLGPGAGDGRSFSDINEIPAALVERIDILTGGASAVYGADAVAGVVNFILNTKFEGVRIDAGYDFYKHHNHNPVAAVPAAAGDALPPSNVNTGFGKNVSLLIGSNFADNKGNATFFATFDTQAAVLQSRFDYSACNLQSHNVGTGGALRCGGSDTSAKNGAGGYFQAYNNATPPVAQFTNTVDGLTGQFRPYNAAIDRFNFGPLNYYRTPNTRWTGGTFLNYDLNSHVNAYAEVMVTRNNSVAQIAPSGDFFQRSFIPCNDPLLTPEEATAICAAAASQGNPVNPVTGVGTGANLYIGRRNAEGGGRQATFVTSTFRTVAGLKGAINDAWTFDVYAQRGTVDNNNGNKNYFSNTNIGNALNVIPGPGGAPVCASGPPCVPWNIWVPNGVTPAATNYLSIPLLIEAEVTEEIVSGSITGDLGRSGVKLPSADSGLQVALGAEWRSESADFRPDLQSQLGTAAGAGGPTRPVTGGFRVKEVFTEARLPLAQHAPFADDLSIEAGYRYSDYSEGFKTNTYKLGLEWAPVRDIRLRGSFNRAVRAPNILELFTPNAVLLDGTTDPCAGIIANGQQPAASAADCVFAGVSAAQYGHVAPNAAAQYNGFLGGNPLVKPETSDTYSFGLVFQPRVVPNLSVSVDYYNIKVKNTIGPLGSNTILQNCVASHDPFYCANIHRDVTGSLWRSVNGFVIDPTINFGSLATKGIDIKANYRVPMATLGSLAFALEGTRQNNLTVQPITNGPSYDCTGFFGATCGAPSPKWRHVFNATWSTPWDAMDVTLRWRHIGEANSEFTSSNPQLAGVALPLTSHIGSYNYFDLTAAFAITKAVRLQIGVNNIADKDPPIINNGGGRYGSDCPTLGGIGVASSCNGNTWPGTYDPLGRYLFAHVTAQF